jgi:hypothetical protein
MFEDRIGADFSDDINEIAFEMYGRADRKAIRRVHYLVSETPEPERLKGLFKLGSKVCMMRTVLRAELERRARGELSAAVSDELAAASVGVGLSRLALTMAAEEDAAAKPGRQCVEAGAKPMQAPSRRLEKKRKRLVSAPPQGADDALAG